MFFFTFVLQAVWNEMQESPIQIGKPVELHAMSKLYNVNSLLLESRIESWNNFFL
jgi:hypothetical protein